MAKYLVVMGHGAGDPGAMGNGTTERDWTRGKLHPAMKKYAGKLKKNTIEFYDTKRDMFQDTVAGYGAYSVSSAYKSITEFHLDAASASATGGHVIISSAFNADEDDLDIANVVKKYAGWWGGVSSTRGINKRNNLANLNVLANRGISYRLVELGFITNSKDVSTLTKRVDELAKNLVEAITGEKIAEAPKPEYKVGQVVTLNDWARIYDEKDKLILPDGKKDSVIFQKGARVTLKKKINANLWEVEFYGINFKGKKPHLKQGNFK
ncbi:N-acetylmuramoyl-L-alanine amidase [Weissella ceti]|uniref:N-acetylmuramoyl-L-alanine amidase n=1 Tax=Weissella ceti TaxID=759620 RepID=A0ABT3E490_9LACO|nr:N-acetylmuramoyl-L-alanine amidase [Weissella ceti]MCW0953236.1 N-acetylmuramoyl-L-alanine amidase [Weissella ceti]QVK12752.1 N-acetylmuramoyl-L-alanine amidase [Weissella ceti]